MICYLIYLFVCSIILIFLNRKLTNFLKMKNLKENYIKKLNFYTYMNFLTISLILIVILLELHIFIAKFFYNFIVSIMSIDIEKTRAILDLLLYILAPISIFIIVFSFVELIINRINYDSDYKPINKIIGAMFLLIFLVLFRPYLEYL